MPVGFQAMNDTGTFLIDGNFRNLCVVKSGTVVTHATNNTAQIVYNGNASSTPLIAYRSTDFVWGFNGVPSSNTWTFNTYSINGSQSVKYWIFDNPPSTVSDFGLIVYNASGQVVFDATRQYMRFGYRRTGANVAGWKGTLSTKSGRTYAVTPLKTAFALQYECINDGQPPSPFGNILYRSRLARGMWKMTSNSVVFDWIEGPWSNYSDFPVVNCPDDNETQLAGDYLVIDVTGY